MPISKKTATVLRKEDKPYEAISRETVQSIKNADALAIWVYLQCKPHNWQIRKKDIMEQLGIGKVRYAKAMADLKELNLITFAHVKDGKGAFQGQIMWCHPEPTEIPENGILRNRVNPEPDCSENGTYKEVLTTKDLQIDKDVHIAHDILNFLNEKTGRNYQPVKVNLDFINARLKEGATPEECRQVIAKKVREWREDKTMNKFLRPATLFNREKFAQYQGELV